MGRVIAVANQKGGVGKTTTSINLSSSLVELGKKVLTIDMDPQGNTTSGLGIDKNEVDSTVYELILDEATIEEAIHPSIMEGLDVIASNINLSGAEVELISFENKGDILEQGTVISVTLSRGKLKMPKFNSIGEFREWADKYGIIYEKNMNSVIKLLLVK